MIFLYLFLFYTTGVFLLGSLRMVVKTDFAMAYQTFSTAFWVCIVAGSYCILQLVLYYMIVKMCPSYIGITEQESSPSSGNEAPVTGQPVGNANDVEKGGKYAVTN